MANDGLQPVDPGLLTQLGRAGLGLASGVGNLLDTPASMARDVLAFQNPIDNLFNPFSSANRVGGRDLMRKYDLVGQEDTYGNWWAGFGAEVALDPLTWLGAGALLKGAQAGMAGSKGLLRASVPGTKYGAELLTGARAEKMAEGLGDLASYVTKASKVAPLVQSAMDLFQGGIKVGGKAQPPGAAVTPPAAATPTNPFAAAVTPTSDPGSVVHSAEELTRVDKTRAQRLQDLEQGVSGLNKTLDEVDEVLQQPIGGAVDPHQAKLGKLVGLSFKELGEYRDKMASQAKADMEIADDLYRRRVTDSRAQAAENAFKNSDYLYKLASEAYTKHPQYDWRKGSTQHLDEPIGENANLPISNALDEAAGKTRIYKAPPGIKQSELLQTYKYETLVSEEAKVRRKLTKAVKNYAKNKTPEGKKLVGELEREFDRINAEIRSRQPSSEYLPLNTSKGLRQMINEDVIDLKGAQDVPDSIKNATLPELQRTALGDFLSWMNNYESKAQLASEVGNLEANKLWKMAKEASSIYDSVDIAQFAKPAGPSHQLEDFLKAGTIKEIDVKPTNIQDIQSVVPKATPDQVSEWAKLTANALTAPGRAMAALFHAPAKGKFGETDQKLAAAQWELTEQGHHQIRGDLSGLADEVAYYRNEFVKHFGTDLEKVLPEHYQGMVDVASKVRKYGESVFRMVGETGDVSGAFREHGLDPGKIPEEMLGRMTSLIGKFKDINAKAYGDYQKIGGAGSVLPKLEGEELVGDMAEIGYFPGFEHYPRFAAESFNNLLGMATSGLVRPEASMARLEPLRAVPARIVEGIGRLVRTGKAGKLKEEDIITAVVDKHGKWLNREIAGKLTPDEIAAAAEEGIEIADTNIYKWGEGAQGQRAHAKALVEWARTTNFDEYLADNLEANSRYLRGIHSAMANIHGMHELVKSTIARAPMEAALAPGVVPKGWKHMRGLATPEDAMEYVSVAKAYQEAGLNSKRAVEHLASQLGDESKEAIEGIMDHGMIPREVAMAMKGSQNVWKLTGYAKILAEISDIPTRWFKENVTLPFVSFATRNLGSGLYMTAASGHIQSVAELKQYGNLLMDHFNQWRNGNIPIDKQREWFTEGVLHEGMVFEGVDTRELMKYGHVAPDPISIKDAWRESGEFIEPSVLDKVPGLHAARQAHGTVLGVGGKANKLIEYLLRAPLYEFLKSKGMNNQQASREVARLMVDYSKHAFSPFENEVMKRLFPFYSWQRKMAPVVLGTLARNPAGLMGQTIRGSRLASSEDPRTPEWMSDTLAIDNPLGSTEEGGRSYITGFGLPYEPTLAFFSGGVRGAGREVLSQLNPLIKAPLEWSTGQSFFQSGPGGTGRPLDELNPPIGQTLSNLGSWVGGDASKPVDLPDGIEFLAANSPLSRYITTARQVTDPRKHPLSFAANLATGVRVTDVSPEAQDAILRHRASKLIRELGGRTFSQSYFPSDVDLNPAEKGLADQLSELKRILDQRSRSRRNVDMQAG